MSNLFSIVMPAYNTATKIGKAISSIKKQTYSNWELIIVDDGSTDDTFQVASNLSIGDTRISVYKQENKGPGTARNFAISKATGNYIAFLDSDDYWDRDFLLLINNVIKRNDSDVVFYDLICENSQRQPIAVHRLSSFSDFPKERIIRVQMTGVLEWGMVKVIRKSLITSNSISFSENSVGEEAIFSFDVLRKAKTISFINKPIYHYIQSSEGQHKKGGNDPWWQAVARMRKHCKGIGVYSEYETTINSFALRALCISCYRCSCFTFSKANKMIKEKVKVYSKYYNFKKVDFSSLDCMAKTVLLLINHRVYFPIVLASKIKNWLRSN